MVLQTHFCKTTDEYKARICGLCDKVEPQTTEFQFDCRHGAAYYACAYHLRDLLMEAFEYDGRDPITIRRIGF